MLGIIYAVVISDLQMTQGSKPGTLASSKRPHSRSRSVVPEEEDHHQQSVQRRPMTRSRSRSQTPSVVGDGNERIGRRGKKRKKSLEIPSHVPSRGESVELEEPPVDVFQVCVVFTNSVGFCADNSYFAECTG